MPDEPDDAFPRTNSFDDDINSGHRAVDLALHVVDLGLQEFLHFLEFRNQLVKFVYRIEVNRATAALISGGPEGLDFSLLSCVAKAKSNGGVFSSAVADVGVSISSSLSARGPIQQASLSC